VELDSRAWPRRVEKRYSIVPTVCFNCEAACGLLAYVDQETMQIRKLEGNPYNPNSRGRNCAKGPAMLNQVQDPERLLYPLRRKGARGSGQWERCTWDEVLDVFASKIRAALQEGRQREVMYHVGRPGEDGYVERVLQAWGIDGHNSHTNVCSSSSRAGYDFWMGSDRPSPDFENARFILLLSSHLETGHYFNPHAQRIIDAKSNGAKLAVVDTRLSNTASLADYWLPTVPGSECALLLAIAKILLDRDLFDRDFVERWVNWQEFLETERPDGPRTFDSFIAELKKLYAEFTLEYAEREAGVSAAKIEAIALEIARAGSAFSSHVWRNAAAGNLGGWQVARCLFFLNVLTGSVGTKGGTLPNSWNKFVPVPPLKPPPQKVWSELLWPPEYPLAHHEMSILLPYLLRENRGKLAAYFVRAYNPVWTNPDGFAWIDMLKDEARIGLSACMTPVWNETAYFCDYVLPFGLGPERHDTMSFETHASQWITYRQPVLRVARERRGERIESTLGTNPGEVWEEDEFWIELSWRIDPDGALGIRKYFESPYKPGTKMSMPDYYRWIFENSVPGLPDKAASEGLSPYDYMRKYGAFEVTRGRYRLFAETGPDGQPRGFPTPSKRLEFYSKTLAEWGWKEHAIPGYARSHVHPDGLGPDEMCLLPTFRLPTQIHTRTANSKWLWEISNTNPAWLAPRDAARIGVKSGGLVRVETGSGYFVVRAMVTEGIRPGVIGVSHHFGRWRLWADQGERWSTSLVNIEERGPGRYLLRQREGVRPFDSSDPDSRRVGWSEVGVHQNLAFPTQPDPISGMHCWHQKVRVVPARPEDRYGDVFQDTVKSYELAKEWMRMARPGPGPGGLRRPRWLARPFRPSPEAYLTE